MSDDERRHVYSIKELTEILVRHAGVTSGSWGVYVEFGIGGINSIDPALGLLPTAMVPIVRLGIQSFEGIQLPEAGMLSTVDAAKLIGEKT